jgi:hypothetical protein
LLQKTLAKVTSLLQPKCQTILITKKMKTEKTFSLIFVDSKSNEIDKKLIVCKNKTEAKRLSKIAFANTMLNDCKKVIVL